MLLSYRWSDFMQLVYTLALAVSGGFLLSLIHAPLPWTLGPILFVSATSYILKRKFLWSLKIRNAALILLGYGMGRPFTAEAGNVILTHLPLMLLATFVTIIAGLFAAWLMFRYTKINFTSCLLGCVPGGLSQMVILADEIPDADLTAVTIMQTLRMLSVVFTIPFLAIHVLPAGDAVTASAIHYVSDITVILTFAAVAISGAFIGKLIHLPTASLLGPILSTATFLVITGSSAPVVPTAFLNTAQVFVGAYIGSSIDLRKIREYNGMGLTLLLGVIMVLIASGCMAIFLSHVTGANLVTMFLSTAPGGLAEMGIVALVVHADTATMTAYQLTRLLFIMLIFPLIAKYIVRHIHPVKKREA